MVNMQHINIILNRWKCEGPCPNKSGHCYIVDNVHLQLFAQHIKRWTMAINEGTADPEMTPELLAKSLQLCKLFLKNPLREKSSTKSDSDTKTMPQSLYYTPYSYHG